MDFADLGPDAPRLLQEIIGHLNFASGTPDARFLKNLNELFGLIDAHRDHARPAWRTLGDVLCAGLAQLRGGAEAFRRADQAEAVLGLVFDAALPAYRRHHRDLLFHQTDERLFQPLFIGRVCEAVLQQGGPWEQSDRIVRGALGHLNDYLGHRPVAVLRTQQKIQPYLHEWVCPIPLYVRGAGVGVGPYRELIERALEILAATDSSLWFQACFDPDLLDELALDPRAYDFDHPVDKRPNYLFGQWDLGRLDNSGRCRRFVLQEVSLSAMLARIDQCRNLPHEEVLCEEAAVLAGTMLMGAGVSGNRPDAHDSSTTLAVLVQRIAAYRDQFYEQFLERLSGPRAQRLRTEAQKLRQPLGAARQHFNHYLVRRRAEQVQHVHLGRLFSRLGYTEAASRQVRMVPVASARIQCDMRCRLSDAHLHIRQGRLHQAAAILPEIEDLLHRGIECGALVDPWNILGFGGQYSLFPALENSIYDDRVDELIELVGDVFALYARIKREAAAAGDSALQDVLSPRLEMLAQWWDRYASVEVSAVESFSGREVCESAEQVAAALRAWHEARPCGGGAQVSRQWLAPGDAAFWRGHAEQFRSPKSYALVVEALLEQGDLVAAMALLVHWLSQAGEIPWAEKDYSFHELALRWMNKLWRADQQPPERRAARSGDPTRGGAPVPRVPAAEPAGRKWERWPLSRKFLDHLEANAEQYAEVPRFELAAETTAETTGADQDEGGPDDLFGAAYEDVVYRDSTDDGFAGELLEGGQKPTDFELARESQRIAGRLAFLAALAGLWKSAAVASISAGAHDPDRDEVLADWLKRATANYHHLLELLRAVQGYRIPLPRGTIDALLQYERHRTIKETLLEQIIATCAETADTARMIRAAVGPCPATTAAGGWEEPAGQVLHALVRGDVAAVRHGWPALAEALLRQPLLYVPLAKGGNPPQILASRSLQCVLRRLLWYLPRLGLLRETVRLMEVIQEMELEHPVGHDSVTEFDRMFRIGCQAVARCLVTSSQNWRPRPHRSDRELIECLEWTTERLLRCWLAHSRRVRLSVLEALDSEKRWEKLKRFIERYGGDLFKQHLMGLGNLRGILHQGADAWLRSLEEEPGAEQEFRLLADLDGPLRRNQAVRHLSLTVEAVVENYPEYLDYNTVTTQSDRGEMLYTLLDFLRLRARYDRVAWNLQPVLLAHEVLVRCGREEAAETWRAAVAGRAAEIADNFLKRYARLSRKYGMRLPSIADRLEERFVRPMIVDRLRGLVRTASAELREGQEPAALKRLEKDLAELTREPAGAGFEVPAWLEALEDEVDQVLSKNVQSDPESLEPYLRAPQIRLSLKAARRQIEKMSDDG